MSGPVLGLIPARGGSKGIPGKNTRLLAGRPLLAYTVEAARASRVIDRLIISTDSAEIAEVARTLDVEVPFLRPPELALDDSPMLPVVEHAVSWVERHGFSPEIIVLLQPTSPFRRPEHIEAAVGMLRETSADSVASVVEVPRHLSPDYVMKIEDGRLLPFLPEGGRITRRQDARPAYERDGTVYAFWRRTLQQRGNIYGVDCRPLIIPAPDSINLDTTDDLEEAERRLRVRQ